MAGPGELQAVDDTVAAVHALAAAGIPTYVLGYDTQTDPALRPSRAFDGPGSGGRGGMPSVRSTIRRACRARVDRITGEVVTCDYLLENKVDPAFVRVEVAVEQVQLSTIPTAGVVRQDERTVSLQARPARSCRQATITRSR